MMEWEKTKQDAKLVEWRELPDLIGNATIFDRENSSLQW